MSVQRGPRGKIIVRPDKGDQDEKIRSEEVRQLEAPKERVVETPKSKKTTRRSSGTRTKAGRKKGSSKG